MLGRILINAVYFQKVWTSEFHFLSIFRRGITEQVAQGEHVLGELVDSHLHEVIIKAVTVQCVLAMSTLTS